VGGAIHPDYSLLEIKIRKTVVKLFTL